MKIGVISLVSAVHDPDVINRSTKPFLSALGDSFDLEEIETGDIRRVDLPVVFVKTGGTEHKFKQIAPLLEKSGKPVTLLAGGSNNALPASLEILAWADQNGFKNSLLLHGPMEMIKQKLEKRLSDIKIIDALKRTKIGVLGKPSEWLIASGVDYKEVSKRWGVTITDIKLEEVIKNITKFSESGALEILGSLPKPQFKKDVSENDILGAVKIYLGLKRTISEYNLSALTLRCFDLLKAFNNTGCLALARLNDEGIPSGCEGDIPALFTMMINHLITGVPSFMANPSLIHENSITLAHCTIPLSITESFGFETHFESGIGVGITGKIKKGPVTLTKIGGPHLDRFYAAEGEMTAVPQSGELCRTQVTIKMEEPLDYFFNSPLGNHHIISSGRHAARFKEIMALFN